MVAIETENVVTDAEISALVETLLEKYPPNKTKAIEFLGAQFDAGLAWVHFEVGNGGLGASPKYQKIVNEAIAAANGPSSYARNPIGYGMCAPTIIQWGTDAQKKKYLRSLFTGEEIWCQLFSEPGSGSDFAGLSAKGVRDGEEWIINGQKVWTSLAHVSHWCFVVARTEPGSQRHAGLTFLLVPMDQPGVEVRPILQLTKGGEFNETFFTDAATASNMVVGTPGNGWGIAMALLGYERGISTLAQQVGFERELDATIQLARDYDKINDPNIRQKLAKAHSGLQLLKLNALRSMSAKGVPGPEASISKLFWGTWHRDLGELMIDIMGPAGLIAEGFPYELTLEQKLFLFTRSDTIYGGSNEIQRNVLGERVLGLPR